MYRLNALHGQEIAVAPRILGNEPRIRKSCSASSAKERNMFFPLDRRNCAQT
jgi:hypothetical protein